jgi:hypothetical protein
MDYFPLIQSILVAAVGWLILISRSILSHVRENEHRLVSLEQWRQDHASHCEERHQAHDIRAARTEDRVGSLEQHAMYSGPRNR